MKKNFQLSWFFSKYFFTFLTIYTAVKFVFILLFQTAFEPKIIFTLTPFFMLASLNKLQLLFLSIIVLCLDSYLHLKNTNKHLKYSFFPSLFILTGAGLSIALQEFSFTHLLSYLMFICLIIVLLCDHKRLLLQQEEVSTKLPVVHEKQIERVGKPQFLNSLKRLHIPLSMKQKISSGGSEIQRFPSGVFSKSKTLRSHKLKTPDLDLEKLNKLDIKKFSSEYPRTNHPITTDFEHFKITLKNLGNKSQKLKRLEQLIRHTPPLSQSYFSIKSNINQIEKKIDTLKTPSDIINEIKQSAVILRRGIIQEANHSFLDIIGYKKQEVIGKNLLDFLSPEGLISLNTYYLNKLKNMNSPNFDIFLLTKNNETIVKKAHTKPVHYAGLHVEIIILQSEK